MDIQNNPFQRRLRLLLAREFAARGHYLDAESFYERTPFHSLETEELEFLVRIAAASGQTNLARSRLEALTHVHPKSEILHTCRLVLGDEGSLRSCKLGWKQWFIAGIKAAVKKLPNIRP